MVPVLDDGGVVVWESNVIVRYLASSRGRGDLLAFRARATRARRAVDGLAGLGLQQQLARHLSGVRSPES